MTQLSFLTVAMSPTKAPRHTASVSRANYKAMQASGRLSARTRDVLDAVRDYVDHVGAWPTRAELAGWMHRHGTLPRNDANLVAPRISELVNGRRDRKTGVALTEPLLRRLPVRPCSVTKTPCHAFALFAAGSGRGSR